MAEQENCDPYAWLKDRSEQHVPSYDCEAFRNVCDDFFDPLVEEIEGWLQGLPENYIDEKPIIDHLYKFAPVVEAIGGRVSSEFSYERWMQTRAWLLSNGYPAVCSDLEKRVSKALSIAKSVRISCIKTTVQERGTAVNLFLNLEVHQLLQYLRALGRELRNATRNAGRSTQPFVMNLFQRKIYEALDGRALKKEGLAGEVCAGEGTRLYRKGGLKELMEEGLVAHRHGLGYYRPDSPPPGHTPPCDSR